MSGCAPLFLCLIGTAGEVGRMDGEKEDGEVKMW